MPGDQSERLPEHVANALKELRIREKAYELWEADGSPQGRSDEYWHRAREIIENEPTTAPGEMNGSKTMKRFIGADRAS
jgi:Protein of unknown function (DUF2934)